MFFKKKKNKLPEVVLTDEEKIEYLKLLIKKNKEDLMNNMVQEWIYLQEVIKPIHMGKSQAETALAQYQKRVVYLKENIQVYEMYAQEHNIAL